MTRPRRLGIAVLVLALGWVMSPRGVVAQDEAVHAEPTLQEVQEHITRLEQLQEAGELADQDKTRLQLYRSALDSLQAATEAARLSAEFDRQETQAPVELEALRAQLAQPPAETPGSACRAVPSRRSGLGRDTAPPGC